MPLFLFPIKTPHHWFWDKARKVPVCVDKIINNDIQFVCVSFIFDNTKRKSKSYSDNERNYTGSHEIAKLWLFMYYLGSI
jgi:hypothetical protein